MHTSPDVSVIIINYNSVGFTRTCLRTLLANTTDLELEVIVLDNASYDGCREMMTAEFPGVIFIQNEFNLGFAGANNRGAAIARGKYILFLNPDTEIQGPAISSLCRVSKSTADAALVGARLLNSDGTVQTTSITAFPSIANQLFGIEYLRKRVPRAKLWGMRPLFDGSKKPACVDAISGACMLARREAFEEVGGFSTDYFMYGEDLDLCLKVTKKGWKVYYVPEAFIVHHGGRSSASCTDNYADLMIRQSMYRFMQLHRGHIYASGFRVVTAASAVARLLLLFALFTGALVPSNRAFVRRAWKKWARVLGWCLGLQKVVVHGLPPSHAPRETVRVG